MLKGIGPTKHSLIFRRYEPSSEEGVFARDLVPLLPSENQATLSNPRPTYLMETACNPINPAKANRESYEGARAIWSMEEILKETFLIFSYLSNNFTQALFGCATRTQRPIPYSRISLSALRSPTLDYTPKNPTLSQTRQVSIPSVTINDILL